MGVKLGRSQGNRGRPRNAELNDFYFSPNILVIKSSRMRWSWHVALVTIGEVYTGFWWGSLKERNRLEDSGVDGRITLIWISRKWDGAMDWIGLDQDRNKWHTFKCGNEHAGL
jgi:hypothetical protein